MMESELFLTPGEVPYGMPMYCIDPESNKPATGKDGSVLPPIYLYFGGVPHRRKWYIFHSKDDGRSGVSFEFDALRKDVRLVPAELFSAEEAPVRRKYAVFVNGERLTYDDYPGLAVRVAKSTDGRILSVEASAPQHSSLEYKLPEDAVLGPVGVFPADEDFKFLGCVGIPEPNTEQRNVLENLGVVFFDYAPFMGNLFRNYMATLLPHGWKVNNKNGPWYKNIPYNLSIMDSSGRQVALIEQKPPEGFKPGLWSGALTLFR